MKTNIKTKWAYRLKNRTFYRRGDRGSFSLAARPYSKGELTVKSVADAALFDNEYERPPYDANFMLGGKWVKILITTTYETVVV